MNKLFRLILDRRFRFDVLCARGFYNRWSDERVIKKKFKLKFGYDLDLENPQTFNEKLQWLKLYDRKPEYSLMVDKYEAKKLAADKIGEEYLIPTLGVWESFDDIDFSKLPEKFVLKCTHDSGSIVICKNKAAFDVDAARKKLSKAMKRNYYYGEREWPYKSLKPRIIAEEFMVDGKTEELRDYKFFCFNGEAKMLFIATGRQSGEEVKFDFFDMDFNHLPIKNGHPNATTPPEKPETFEQMKEIAAKLSEGIPQVRVDLYEINGRIYFGELTFAHFGGFVKIEPKEWDEKMGKWVLLPQNIKE